MDKDKILKWAEGLIGAGISSAATAISATFVDPSQFNFSTGHGLGQIGKLIAGSAIVGMALYLKQSPLPKKE